MCKATLTAIFIFLSLFAITELSARRINLNSFAAPPLEDSDAGTYYAKSQAFAQSTQAIKIAIIGDSVANGGVLKEHGINNWKSEELTANLRTRLHGHSSNEILIANFGEKDARPTDSDFVIENLLSRHPNVIIYTVGMRGFSSDFESEEYRYGKSWRDNSLASRSVRIIAQNCFAYMLTRFWIWSTLGGPPDHLLANLRSNLGSPKNDDDLDSLSLALKAKARLKGAAISSSRFQSQAFVRSLHRLRGSKTHLIVVYETENPDFVETIVASENLASFRSSLAELTSEPDVTYVGPDSGVTSDDFLDHIHPSPKGYKRLADAILPELEKQIHKSGF